MAEVTKVREALVAELLGDVDNLVERVEDLERKIHGVTGEASQTIANQVDRLVDAQQKLVDHLQELTQKSGELASQKMSLAREVEEARLRDDMQQAVTAAAQAAVGQEIKQAVSAVIQALGQVEASAERASAKVSSAAETLRPDWSKRITALALLVALSAGIGALTAKATAPSFTPPPQTTQQQ